MIRIRTYGKEKTVENLATLRRLVERGRLDLKDEAFNPLEEDWVPLRYIIEDAEEDSRLEALLNAAPPQIQQEKNMDADTGYEQSQLNAYKNAASAKDYVNPSPPQRQRNVSAGQKNRKVKHAAQAQNNNVSRSNPAVNHDKPAELFFWQKGTVIILALIFFVPLGIMLLLMRPRGGLLGNPLVKAILILGFAAAWLSSILPEEVKAAEVFRSFQEAG